MASHSMLQHRASIDKVTVIRTQGLVRKPEAKPFHASCLISVQVRAIRAFYARLSTLFTLIYLFLIQLFLLSL
jgi:hypothetical protein